MIKDDVLVNDDVVEELKDDPAVDSSRIAVAVNHGVVTLRGSVPSYWQKVEAAKAARLVAGVQAVANDVKVDVAGTHARDDTDIATAAVDTIKWHSDLPDTVEATVDNGWVTLTGTVDWQFQRNAVENAIRHLSGVRGVTNNIQLKARPQATDVREQIRKELARTVNRDVDDIDIDIDTSNGHVTLRGTVSSREEDEAARRASWSVPGVTELEDHLIIG
jgi:osmotically-inducible protein OsmY